METTLKGTMRAMHTATGLPFPLFSLSFQVSWPIRSKFFVLYSSKLVLYMIEGGILKPLMMTTYMYKSKSEYNDIE